jgi:F-type H+-transporting ATPase subunit beta
VFGGGFLVGVVWVGFVVGVVLWGWFGEYVSIADTVRGFKEILDGKHDDVPETNFYMKGGIEMIAEGK